MDTIETTLNKRFGQPGSIHFRQVSPDVVVVDIDNPAAQATVSLLGGQVLVWHPKSQVEPVLWLSERARFEADRAIRGGVPICWPWFGGHPTSAALPTHGYARISPWTVDSVQSLETGATAIHLTMAVTDIWRGYEGGHLGLKLCIVVGQTLALELTTHNDGEQPVMMSEGLHTYFLVGDVERIRVHGLEGGEYVDLLRNNLRCTQSGPILFKGELCQIYVNNSATCCIEDPVLHRRIYVEKTGSLSTAVWNPWTVPAGKMDDLGAQGWRSMVCVESANALENSINTQPGGSSSLGVVYRAEHMG